MRKRAKLHRFRWRIFQRLIAVTLLLIATGFYFSDHILNWGVHTLSARLFPETSLSFQTVQLKKGKLQFTQVRMEGEQGEVIAPHLSIRGEFKIRPFVILPHIKMKGPQITLTEGLRALESVLYTSDQCIPSITIDNGTLLWKDHRIDFSLQSSQGKEGELRSSEHNIFCSWKQTERGLGFELNL